MDKTIWQVIDDATNELAEALADFDAKISADEAEAYECMRKHVEQAQIMLLELLKVEGNAT